MQAVDFRGCFGVLSCFIGCVHKGLGGAFSEGFMGLVWIVL